MDPQTMEMHMDLQTSADTLKPDINLLFTITSCQIVRSQSLTRRISYKFASVRLLTKKK